MKRHDWVAMALCSTVVFGSSTAFGQASETEMKAFPMPPPSGYFAQKNFSYVGDYGYYTAPATAQYGTSAGASDYRYVRYTGVWGKRVFVYGAWGPSTPPDPPGPSDACGHAHASWGAWGKYQIKIGGFFPVLSGWLFLGGGGMSGQRNASGVCKFSPNNPLSSIDPRFGWGVTFKEVDLRNTSSLLRINEIVVGALSNTHGWGTCSVPAGEFPACVEPSYVIGYTLP